ncbi:hypothetical protein QJS10_CPA09g01065 [Acorus calamus]|uniref:Uncharacterized protein n=1 Tax=Acorus calamus TaxID=4465 RepID=A0AAV9E6E5_ACOCL|nr:hypothetical protein QJS10_CPA09g01065 [Acorus calamus]
MYSVFAAFLLIVQSMVAIHRSRNDMSTVSFIIGVDIDMALLSWTIYAHEKAPIGSKQRERLNMFIWLLATLLNMGFAYKVSMVIPLVLSLILWALVAVTTVSTFHLYFLRLDKRF